MYELLRTIEVKGYSEPVYKIIECLPYLGPIADKIKELILSGVPRSELSVVKVLTMDADVIIDIVDEIIDIVDERGNNNASK